MTPEQANAAIDEIYDRMGSMGRQFSDDVAAGLGNPDIPMLLRCTAMARVTGTAAQGLYAMTVEDAESGIINRIHMVETLPDLIIALRAAADLFEAANKGRTH